MVVSSVAAARGKNKKILNNLLNAQTRKGIELTTAVRGRRLAGALVLGPGVSSWQTRRLNSLNSFHCNSVQMVRLLQLLKIVVNVRSVND